MGGSSGGGSSQPQQVTQTVSQFPEEAKPYYTRLLSRGEAESLQPYSAFPAQRLAEFAPEEEESFQMASNLARQGMPWAMQQAQQTAGELAQGIPSWAQQQALQTSGQFARGTPFEPWTGFQQQRRPISPFMGGGFGRQQPYGMGRQQSYGRGMQQRIPPRWGGGGPRWGQPMYDSPMQRYMSPYQQGVIDVQKERAFFDANRMRSDIGLKAAQAGGLGGYREGIVESNLNRDLMRQLGDIQQTGQQSAYQNAQRMFEADRAAKLAAGQQQLGAAQQLGGLDLSNLQQRLSSAQMLGGFAPTAQQMALSRIGALGGAGQARRGFQQAGMDIGLQDFLTQRGYPQQQLGFQSDILRGLQLRPNEIISQYAQRPGLFQQALGTGLGALGLYQGFGK